MAKRASYFIDQYYNGKVPAASQVLDANQWSVFNNPLGPRTGATGARPARAKGPTGPGRDGRGSAGGGVGQDAYVGSGAPDGSEGFGPGQGIGAKAPIKRRRQNPKPPTRTSRKRGGWTASMPGMYGRPGDDRQLDLTFTAKDVPWQQPCPQGTAPSFDATTGALLGCSGAGSSMGHLGEALDSAGAPLPGTAAPQTVKLGVGDFTLEGKKEILIGVGAFFLGWLIGKSMGSSEGGA